MFYDRMALKRRMCTQQASSRALQDEIETFLLSTESKSEQESPEEKQSPAESTPVDDVGQKRKQAPSQPAVESKAVKKDCATGTGSAAAGTSSDKQYFLSELKRVEVRSVGRPRRTTFLDC